MPPKKRYLYVEDNPDSCELIRKMFPDAEVTCAANGRECLELTKSGDFFDVYLFDHYLPDTTGIELCREVRHFNPYTPIVFITASNDLSVVEVRSAGAQGLVRKSTPYFIDQLKQTISDIRP